ncbi:hypothetical protein EKK58_07690 [Candidatus Dependentiae bacterium]|nr:MAG: hypothetical protein EKK58_07690 [Candidatus Dependentiae bacterium]
MSNRFVQYRPLDYTPVTEPLEILKESLVNRRKLIDAVEDQQDKLALITVKGIPGTDWENKAAERRRWLDQIRTEASNYLMENSGDLYGAKRKLREVQNKIMQDFSSGESGAIKSAYESYAKTMEDLQKEAGKKDSYSLDRLSKQDQLYKLQQKNLGKFDPIRGTYEHAASLSAPPAEFDLWSRMKDVISVTPELQDTEIVQGRDGWFILDKKTQRKHKDSDVLINNMRNSLANDTGYLEDLKFKTKYFTAVNGLDASNPEDAQKILNYQDMLSKQNYNQIGGYSYSNIDQDLKRTEDPGLKIQLQREKLSAEKSMFASLVPDQGNIQEAEVDYLSDNSALEDASSYWNGIYNTVNAVYTKNGIYVGGPNYHDDDIEDLMELNKLEKINKEISDKLNISYSDLSSWISKQDKNKSYSNLMKEYIKKQVGEGIPKSTIHGYEIPFDERKNRTIDLVSNPNYRVYVVKNGKVVKDGRDYTMGQFKSDYSSFFSRDGYFKKLGPGTFETTHFVPPSKQIPEYTYKMVGDDGEIIYVAPTKVYNSRDQSDIKDYHTSYNSVQTGKASKLVLPSRFDSKLTSDIESALRTNNQSLLKYGNPNNIVGYELESGGTSKNPQNLDNKKLYSKVYAIYQEPSGKQKKVLVYDKQNMRKDLDLDEGIKEILKTMDQEVYKREVGTTQRNFYKGEARDFTKLRDIFN